MKDKLTTLAHRTANPDPLHALTSIEQKIHKIKVWTTTKSAEPIPKAK